MRLNPSEKNSSPSDEYHNTSCFTVENTRRGILLSFGKVPQECVIPLRDCAFSHFSSHYTRMGRGIGSPKGPKKAKAHPADEGVGFGRRTVGVDEAGQLF